MTTSLQNLGIKPDLRPEVRVRMGRKGDRGGVVEKDRFHLCTGRASGAGMKAVSDPHPSFAAFNGAEARYRQELRGTPIHALGGAWAARRRLDLEPLRCCPPPRPRGPAWDAPVLLWRRRPCASLGARQVDGHRLSWRRLPVPAAPAGGEERGDGLQADLHLVFPAPLAGGRRSRPLPSCPAFIESGGPWSYATMQWWGFYQGIQAQWVQMGGAGEPDLYGLPIRLSCSAGRSPAAALRWVPELYTDFAAGQTLQGFLAWRAAQAEAARPSWPAPPPRPPRRRPGALGPSRSAAPTCRPTPSSRPCEVGDEPAHSAWGIDSDLLQSLEEGDLCPNCEEGSLEVASGPNCSCHQPALLRLRRGRAPLRRLGWRKATARQTSGTRSAG